MQLDGTTNIDVDDAERRRRSTETTLDREKRSTISRHPHDRHAIDERKRAIIDVWPPSVEWTGLMMPSSEGRQ